MAWNPRQLSKRLVSKLNSGVVRARAIFKSQRFGFSPTSLYTAEFYRDHVDSHQRASVTDVVDIVMELFAPKSVFDVGCGNGIYLAEFANRGVFAAGCDGSSHAVHAVDRSALVFQHDLKSALFLNRCFDVSMCFEVAEHLPAKFAANLVESCAKASNVCVFSSAPPGQGGTDHINERPESYWDALFAAHGMSPQRKDTEDFRRSARERSIVEWLARNTRVYRR